MVENERSAKEPRTRRRKTQYRAENVKQNYRMKADRVDVQNRPTKLADRPPGLRVFQYVASIAEKHTTAPRQVDLWTQSTTGCACTFNATSNDCACCVPSGGCSCGAASPDRCAQCGLEQHCANMCNITLDSRQLFSKSDRGFGQIKSPYLQGPSRCTYRFVPDTGQRVELQIYRLVSIGRHNGTAKPSGIPRCEGGWLQLEGSARVCGRNQRFDRPVVLFSDKPVATLHMHDIQKIEFAPSNLRIFAKVSCSSSIVNQADFDNLEKKQSSERSGGRVFTRFAPYKKRFPLSSSLLSLHPSFVFEHQLLRKV
ncbi:hypothetical protein ALC53_06288 [Atta colombica]|uniref:CUB domain-containing protein n=1 Tax=Atta colombica TaxID=520822 RepID=A0A195BEM2_9HYME|nr:hypothetical protein ALC53_06288 [Atta colombica]